jgi:toluene monooxygenase system ferredoxin subunit
MGFLRAAELDELWDGEMASFTVGGRKVLLVRLGEAICAYEDRCAHLGVALSEGQLDDRVITCSAHHYQYDALTGCGVNPKAVCLIRFPVKIDAGAIWVDVAAGRRALDIELSNGEPLRETIEIEPVAARIPERSGADGQG